MNTGTAVRIAIAFTILLLLHFTLRPALGWRAPIDFLLIGVMVVSVRVRPGVAAVLGMIAGLLADMQTPSTLGSSAFALASVAFAASFLKASFFSEKSSLNVGLILIGKLAYDIIFIVLERRIAAADTAGQLLLWTPLAAIVTAAAALVTLGLMRPLFRGMTA